MVVRPSNGSVLLVLGSGSEGHRAHRPAPHAAQGLRSWASVARCLSGREPVSVITRVMPHGLRPLDAY